MAHPYRSHQHKPEGRLTVGSYRHPSWAHIAAAAVAISPMPAISWVVPAYAAHRWLSSAAAAGAGLVCYLLSYVAVRVSYDAASGRLNVERRGAFVGPRESSVALSDVEGVEVERRDDEPGHSNVRVTLACRAGASVLLSRRFVPVDCCWPAVEALRALVAAREHEAAPRAP